MPDIVDIFEINDAQNAPKLNVALTTNALLPAGIDTVQSHIFLITGDPGKGKSVILASMVRYMLRFGNAKVYLKDSLSAGLYAVASLENVTDLDELEDEYGFAGDIGALIDKRRAELTECRKNNGDLAELKAGWQQIIFALDNLAEFAENGPRALAELIERIAKKESGLKVAVWAAGNTGDISSAYDAVVKVFKDAQCGILLGSVKERTLFNVSVPYGSYEKPEFEVGEGYLIIRNKLTGIKAAVDADLI